MSEVRIDSDKLLENSEHKWDVSSMTAQLTFASILSSRNIQVRCCSQQIPAALCKLGVAAKQTEKKTYLFGKEVSLSLSLCVYDLDILYMGLSIYTTHTNILIS